MPATNCYVFGEFRLDTRSRVLFRSGEMVGLYPKAIDVLIFLVESRGNVATKEELLERVWPDTFVEESTLTRSVSALRKALGDTPEGHTYILTVPKRGYRFVCPFREESADGAPGASKLAMPSENGSRASKVAASASGWPSALIAVGLLMVLLGSAIVYLARLRAKTATVQRIMIAVLPVQNLTGDADREFISDGLTEGIIAQLGRINPERLGVIARTLR